MNIIPYIHTTGIIISVPVFITVISTRTSLSLHLLLFRILTKMSILVTGGAGFIGSNFILDWFKYHNEPVINLDKLTYAGKSENLSCLKSDHRYHFVHGDINDHELLHHLFSRFQPHAIIHMAAESHVDNSINVPENFINTNIVGTFRLLDMTRKYLAGQSAAMKRNFRFLHISTDEVYGTLIQNDLPFTEESRILPNNPYSASKAGSDHLVRAYLKTYNIPCIITHCCNNYGPYQHPEKLIPRIITSALSGKEITIYGDGQQIRDWIYVSDHCTALRMILEKGEPGEIYNIGASCEKTNLEITKSVCHILDKLKPCANGQSYSSQIIHIHDRPGHDRRYAIHAGKLRSTLGWQPKETFENALYHTVHWYLTHPEWITHLSEEYPSSDCRQL